MSNTYCQLLRQKTHQKFSVMKTKTSISVCCLQDNTGNNIFSLMIIFDCFFDIITDNQ